MAFVKEHWEALEAEKSSFRSVTLKLSERIAQVSSDLYSLYALEGRGATPDRVVDRHLRAWQARDWSAEFACVLVEDGTTPVEYSAGREHAPDFLEYTIDSCEMRAADVAPVRTTYAVRFSPLVSARCSRAGVGRA